MNIFLENQELLEQIYLTDEMSFLKWSYRTLLGRNPDDSGYSTYLNKLACGTNRLDVLVDICNSKEFSLLHNKLHTLDGENFLLFAYRSCLARAPDKIGIDTYLTQIENGSLKKGDLVDILNGSHESKTSPTIKIKNLLLPFLGHYIKIKKHPLDRILKHSKIFSENAYLTATLRRIQTSLEVVHKQMFEVARNVSTAGQHSNESEDPSSDTSPPVAQIAVDMEVHSDPYRAIHEDIDWSEFSNTVLSKRYSYKGVFIQELVIDWNVPLYQRPQHISTALGRLGYLVIYRTTNWTHDDVNGFRNIGINVWLTNSKEIDDLEGAIHSIYSTAYADDPENLINRKGKILYEYIDHIDPEISGDEENINRLIRLRDFAFNGGADYIAASAQQLYEEAATAVGQDRVLLLPNGVDTEHYRSSSHLATPISHDMLIFRDRFKKIIGYFGALAPWLWYDVITEIVKKRQDLGFVFIGPDYYGGSLSLPKSDNLLYLGPIDYKMLPAYGRLFDVCFIPFKPGPIAQTTSPLKLFEYFALEKPVVVTSDMHECTKYPEVLSGSSAESISTAIDSALILKDVSEFKLRLRQLADSNDWLQRAKALDEFLRNK